MSEELFKSFFMGGIECSTHRLPGGKRLDLINATQHDKLAAPDFELLQSHGIHSVRDGLRWHLIEKRAGQFDFSSAAPLVEAARQTGTQVIWDLWHYGWPDGLDIFSAAFVDRFREFARAAATLLSDASEAPYISPINEISFFSWAGGEGGALNPFAKNRGGELKRQLARATIEAIDAMREVDNRIRFFQIDPIINVSAKSSCPEDTQAAEDYRQSQFEAWDMICGRSHRDLGGREEFLDVIGVNYYIHNQWTYPGGHGSMIVPSDPRYRHVRDMLEEVFERYRRPLFVAETGIEDETRPAWLRYMANEVYAAIQAGVPVQGLCLYPIFNHPGWDDDRHCHNGLFDFPEPSGTRRAYQPLADALAHEQQLLADIRSGRTPFVDRLGTDTSALDWAAHIMETRTDEARAPAHSSEPAS